MKRLQFPKNELARLVISLIIVWFWQAPFWDFLTWLFSELCMLTGGKNPSEVLCLGNYSNTSKYIITIIGTLISMKFIWFPQRPKITRSNFAREYGDTEFIEDLILKMEYLEMKEKYKSDSEK
tara:strand:+ start:1014 stop:1382 length:369 start_codon:yes stop_codon:yes gene_type:complete